MGDNALVSSTMRAPMQRGNALIPSDTVPVALGRHALGLIAQDLRDRGISHLAVPAYHCLTMLTPFQLEGFHIDYASVGGGDSCRGADE